ncbi:hypothetical protein VW29_13570 [Devosia limi DSM 17137]|uniref:N-acetyltransferase domain-containing protein n=1 Tax=Devosia limi DSM 17137 TaxID=1121477 RepID=A0A0F5LNW7_9HYPH|nr:hypothetical protein VW29_13570 [Devosia limi DSM 17137]
MRFRHANPDDFVALCLLDTFAAEHPKRREAIAIWINEGACIIAEVNGEATGYAVLTKHFFGAFFIEMLMVGNRFRGRGFGLALLRHLQAQCAGSKLFSSTNMSNRTMQNLLLKAGFKPSGYIDNLDVNDPELVFFYPAYPDP